MSEATDNSTRPRLAIVSIVFACMAWIVLIAGFVMTIMETTKRQSVVNEIRQLEEELGVIRVTDPERCYFVAIDNSKVPDVIVENVDRIWQFRYFLPAGYDMCKHMAHGRIAAEGFYSNGGGSGGSSRPKPEAVNKRLAISLTKQKQHIKIDCSFGSSFHWRPSDPDVDINKLVIKPVVSIGDSARSFGPKEIVPVLKIYDPASAKEKIVDGQKLTTYSGAYIAIHPRSQESRFQLLQKGKSVEFIKMEEAAKETDPE